jgi:hypothetical protein
MKLKKKPFNLRCCKACSKNQRTFFPRYFLLLFPHIRHAKSKCGKEFLCFIAQIIVDFLLFANLQKREKSAQKQGLLNHIQKTTNGMGSDSIKEA